MNENNWYSRWSKDQIRSILIEQFESFEKKDTGILRSKLKDIEKASHGPHAVIVSGLRRVGKSTLLLQEGRRLGFDQFYFINFEDERFIGFKPEDFNILYQMLIETFGERKIFILDEVQNITGWEYFVRRFMDMGFKFYISGSNASLLSQELGTRLTGRYVPIELFPFSFKEYLDFRNKKIANFNQITTTERGRINKAFNDYLKEGGIPDALKYPDLPLLRNLYDDIIYRDIVTRYHLEAVTALKELAYFLLGNPAGTVSFNKLKNQLKLGSVNTITSFMEYLQNGWLFFTLNQHAFSVKRQQIAAKKVYCIDTGLANTVGYHFSPNTGRLIENLVFLTLRQQTRSVFYLQTPGGYEIDFFLPEKGQLIQVCQHLDNMETRTREYRAIEDAAREVKVTSALLLSEKNENDTVIGKIPVKIQATPEFLISQSF